MAYVLQLLDTAGAVVFDLQNPAGTGVNAGLKTDIADTFNLGAPTGSPEFFQPQNQPGGSRTSIRDELVEAQILVDCSAATADAMLDGVNNLTALLRRHSTLKFVRDGSAVVRYIDFVHAEVVNTGFDGDYGLMVQAKTAQVLITLTRQPYLRGDLVTAASTSVSHNPATVTNGRVLQITNVGNAPAPLHWLRITSPSGQSLDHVVGLLTPLPGFDVAAYMTSTHFQQVEALSGGTDFSVVADAAASGGSTGRVSFTASTAMIPRVIPTQITANYAGRKGQWDVYLRAKVSASNCNVRLIWGNGTGGSATVYTNPSVTVASTTYREYKLGRIDVVDTSLHTSMIVGLEAERPSGSGTLDMDVLSFVPVDQQAVFKTLSNGFFADDKGRVYNTTTGTGVELAGPQPFVLQPGTNVFYTHSGNNNSSAAIGASFPFSYAYYPRYYA